MPESRAKENCFPMKRVVVAAVLAVLVTLVAGSGVALLVRSHRQHNWEAAQKESVREAAWKKANVRGLMSLSIVDKFTEDEQFQLDRAGDNLEQLQSVLLVIHEKRFEIWNKRSEELLSRVYSSLGIEPGASVRFTYAQLAPYADLVKSTNRAHAEADGYRASCKKIEGWHPSPLASFVNNTAVESGSDPLPTHDDRQSPPLKSPENAPSSAQTRAPMVEGEPLPEAANEPISFKSFYAKVTARTLPVGQRYSLNAQISELNGFLFLVNPDYPNGPDWQLTAKPELHDPSTLENLVVRGNAVAQVVASSNGDGTVTLYSAH